jgi:hypothetical protein
MNSGSLTLTDDIVRAVVVHLIDTARLPNDVSDTAAFVINA